MSSRSALAPHHAAIKAQILRLLSHASPDDLRRFLEEISIQQDVLENIYDLWPDLPYAYETEREELDERKEVYILYDAALDDREKVRHRWERLLGKQRWGRHEIGELKKCRDYMARNAVKMVGLCIEYAEFSSQIQGLAPIEDELRFKLEKLYVSEGMSTTSKLRKMRNLLASSAEARPRAERYSYRRRSLSPLDDEETYYVSKAEPSRGSYVSKHRGRPDREHKRHRRNRDEHAYVYDEPTHPVYLADSPRHPFRSSSHDTSFLWRARTSLANDDDYYNSGRRFSHSHSNLVPLHEGENRIHSSSGSKHHREPVRHLDGQHIRSPYLDVPKPKYTSWEVYEIV